jgi:hypothetical protein
VSAIHRNANDHSGQHGRTSSGERIDRTARCLPASRWASYLKRPKSINDSMHHARDLVRNKAGFGDIPPAWVVCFSPAKKS